MAPPADLRAWLDLLEREGELVRVGAEVDPDLEITEIVDRTVKRGGPALLFEHPKGSSHPLLINQFGTERRMCLALGVRSLAAVAARVQDVLEMQPPQGLAEKVRGLKKLKSIADSQPKRVRGGACQEVVFRGDDVDLDALPIQRCWPGDPAPFITLPAVITRDPRTGTRNVGLYRMQKLDRRSTAMHWQIHKDGRADYLLADGRLDAAEPFPVFHVTAVTMRRNAIYPSIVVGRPPQEDAWLGKATERIFLPAVRMTVPEIVDYDLPVAGAFHNCAIVSIRKAFPGHAQKVMHAVWGLGLLGLTKAVVVVDEWVDVHDYDEVFFRACANVDPKRDVLLSGGPLDQLDHAPALESYGGKLGIDATHKGPDEGARPWPEEIRMSDEVRALVDRRWAEYGIAVDAAANGRRGVGRVVR